MRAELEQRLTEKYPALFAGRSDPPTHSLMCFGCECGDGWYAIIDKACAEISTADPRAKLTQVKEKYGTLRMYLVTASDDALDAADRAEEASASVCELCGARGYPSVKGWIMTRCDKCHGVE